MATQPINPNSNQPAGDSVPLDLRFGLMIVLVFTLVIGTFMFVFSLAYIRDLETLSNLPDLVWSFVCGVPLESDITLPLLITLGILAYLVSGVLFGWRWYLKRRA